MIGLTGLALLLFMVTRRLQGSVNITLAIGLSAVVVMLSHFAGLLLNAAIMAWNTVG
ncbi:hypothetical protein GCM10027456_58280 [Kineosporia babensis]